MIPDVTRQYAFASGDAWENRELPASLGQVITGPDGYQYRFVQNVDAVAITEGLAVCFSSDDDLKSVTADRAGGTSTNTRPAGMAMNAASVADLTAFWIQVTGLNRVAMLTDGGVAAEDQLIAHATTNGGLDTAVYAAASDPSTSPGTLFGKALNADTSTAMAIGDVMLECPTMQPSGAIA